MARRRRRLAAITAATLLAAGCGSGGDDPEATASPVAEVCTAEEHPPLQAGSHLIGDTDPPVPYSSVPPTSGWHASGPPAPGVHEQPLTDPQIVSLLEQGQIVAVYDPAALDEEAVARLEELGAGRDRLNVTPANTDVPAPVTLAAWGVLQRCDDVSADAVTTFVRAHHGQTEGEH